MVWLSGGALLRGCDLVGSVSWVQRAPLEHWQHHLQQVSWTGRWELPGALVRATACPSLGSMKIAHADCHKLISFTKLFSAPFIWVIWIASYFLTAQTSSLENKSTAKYPNSEVMFEMPRQVGHPPSSAELNYRVFKVPNTFHMTDERGFCQTQYE